MIEADTISKIKDFHKSCKTEHDRDIEGIKENFRYFMGDQWDERTVKKLDAKGKPHLTYNEIMPKIQLLFGEYLQNEQEIVVLPRKNGTSAGSKILTAVAKHAQDLSKCEYHEAKCYAYGLIGGMGILQYGVATDDDPENKILFTRQCSPLDIIWDETSLDYDLNADSRFITRQWWWTKEEIEMEYPDKIKDIQSAADDGEDNGDGGIFYRKDDGYRSNYGDTTSAQPAGDLDSSQHGKLRITETWWKSYKKLKFLKDRSKQFELVRITPETEQAAKMMMAMNPQQFYVVEKVSAILHKTVLCGNVVLEDTEDPYGLYFNKLPFVRFCPFWYEGYFMGLVKNLKDPQNEINKRMSQVLHILNTTANKAWLNKRIGGAKKEDLVEQGSKIGSVIEYDEVKPEQTDAPTLPSGHFQMSQAASEFLTRVSGVNEPMMGNLDQSQQSGLAIRLRQTQGRTMLLPVFNQMKLSRQLLYEGIIELIQKTDLYTKEEVIAICDEDEFLYKELVKKAQAEVGQEPQPPPMPNEGILGALDQIDPEKTKYVKGTLAVMLQRKLQEYNQQKAAYDEQVHNRAVELLIEQMKSAEFGKYGIKVTESVNSPTHRLSNFAMLMDARRNGLMIPDDEIIEASDFPNKERIIEKLKAMQIMPQAPQPQKVGA